MKHVKPSGIEGGVDAPASKSMMQRAVAAAVLAKGASEIVHSSYCDDAEAALGIAEALGAEVERWNGSVKVVGGERRARGRFLNCGESGLCMRMFSPVAALYGNEITLGGRGSLLSRPVGMVEGPLSELGVRCRSRRGNPPLTVHGPMHGGRVNVDGSTTSQFLSGLLIALPVCGEDSEILVKGLKSTPYVQMTVDLLKEFRVEVSHDEGMERFTVAGGQEYMACEYAVEGDWSGASFLLVAGAVGGKAKVGNLSLDSLQADKAILDALEKAGAKVRKGEEYVEVEGGELNGFEFDAADCPDLFPPLVALACNCSGKSVISGAGRLKHKESDRGAALVSEFGKLGADVKVEGDVMEVTGGRVKGGVVDSHGDHRIAMACAVAALNSEEGVSIRGEECVSKSYPGFFRDLESLVRG